MNKEIAKAINYILFSVCIFIASNFYFFKEITGLFWLFIVGYLLINIFPLLILPKEKRIAACAKGNGLLIEFLGSTALSVVLFILSFTSLLPIENMFSNTKLWVVNTLIAILFEAPVFWNGLLRVFFSSKCLGLKTGVKALICGLIPVVNIFVLRPIIKTVADEIEAERI
jgi:triacylglycerol lipase